MPAAGVRHDPSQYSPEIDGLRALAVLAVVANHLDSRLLPSGHLGVDVFFVISGYVITASLCGRRHRSFGELVAGFYERRIRRLLPALVLCVLGTSLAIALFDPNPVVSLKTGIAALFGVSNLYLLRHAIDYFGASAETNVFTHTWSLGVEEQFYLLFPLVLWLTGLGRTASGSRSFAATIGVASLASLAFFFYLDATRPPAAFYLMPARFWELGAGCLVFVLVDDGRGAAARLLRRLSPLALLLATLVVLAWPSGHLAGTTVAAVLLTALLIASLRPGTAGHRLLSQPAAVYVGQISYSLYLWHWSVVAVSRWTVGVQPWTMPLQLALMFLLAHASWRYVERPLRYAAWAPRRGQTIAYGLLAAILAAAALAALAKPLRGALYTGQAPRLAAVGTHTLVAPYSRPDGSVWRGLPCVLSDNDAVGQRIAIEDCTLGDFAAAQRRVLVLGNSHSAAFTQAFDELVDSDHYAVTLTSSWGASPVAEIPNRDVWGLANDYYWSEVVPSLLARLQPGDWVFLVNDLARLSPRHPSDASRERLRQLHDGLLALSDRLAARGVRLAVLHGMPFAREANCEPAAAIPQWFAPGGGPCHYLSRAETLSRRADLDAVLTGLQERGKLAVVDLMPLFCPGETCTYRAGDGTLLYRDSYSHPSVEAVRLAAPVIRAVLTAPIAPEPPEPTP